MTSVGTWWRTLRHLRLSQTLGRIRYRVIRPVPDLRPAPPLRPANGKWVMPAQRAGSIKPDGAFYFLNESHHVNNIGWDNENISKLWRYNLHYFDDLNAHDAKSREMLHQDLLARWVSENPPGQGSGWEPYPTSLRIVNVIKWVLAGGNISPAQVHSLAVQTRWLADRLEWHLLGNHLFSNAKALLTAGLFFDGPEADRWRQTALGILDAELPEQILQDGGQFERSPMYHALAFEDVLDLLNLVECYGAPSPAEMSLQAAVFDVAPRMLRWLRCMTFPDGGVTHFNDSVDGIAPPLAELERYASVLGITAEYPTLSPVVYLAESGYVRLSRRLATLWIDLAPVGPDYLPGHAHADTLSFELALSGQAILVNRGTSCYDVTPRRIAERGTGSHNTVQLGDLDSSEVWSGFRVGRRAMPHIVEISDRTIAASHDGYRYLPGNPIHRREWQIEEGFLDIHDHITPKRADGRARFHFAPGIEVTPRGSNEWEFARGGRLVGLVTVRHAHAYLEQSSHASAFGIVEPAISLCCDLLDGSCSTRWSWIN